MKKSRNLALTAGLLAMAGTSGCTAIKSYSEVDALNDALGTKLKSNFLRILGRKTLRLEDEFNIAAGFTDDDDELPDFFYQEALPPTNNKARHHTAEVNKFREEWLAQAEA